MINYIKGMFDSIRGLFQTNPKGHNIFHFKQPHKVNLRDIESQAKKDAFSTNEINSDPVVLSELKRKFREYWNSQYSKAQDELHRLESIVDNCLNNIKVSLLKANLESDSHAYMKFSPEQFEFDLEQAHDQFKQRKDNLETFRKVHQRHLLPIRIENQHYNFIVLGILFFIEVFINWELFVQLTGSTTEGRLVAITLSLSQTFINIVTCFLAGRYLFGRVVHFEPFNKKIISLTTILFHAFFIIWLNLAVGMYRAIITSAGNSGQLITNDILSSCLWPFAHISTFDMPSVLVAGVGIVLALLSYIDGYFSDDPYPHYGVIYREFKKTKDKGTAINHLYQSRWNEAIREYKDYKNLTHNEGHTNIKNWSAASNDMQKIAIDYEAIVKGMNKDYLQAIKTYESSFNSFSRNKDKKIKLTQEEVFDKNEQSADKTFSDVSEKFIKDGDRAKRFHSLIDNFDREYKKEVEILDVHNKKIDAQLEQIRKKYVFQ